jgi:hypothetical protein
MLEGDEKSADDEKVRIEFYKIFKGDLEIVPNGTDDSLRGATINDFLKLNATEIKKIDQTFIRSMFISNFYQKYEEEIQLIIRDPGVFKNYRSFINLYLKSFGLIWRKRFFFFGELQVKRLKTLDKKFLDESHELIRDLLTSLWDIGLRQKHNILFEFLLKFCFEYLEMRNLRPALLLYSANEVTISQKNDLNAICLRMGNRFETMKKLEKKHLNRRTTYRPSSGSVIRFLKSNKLTLF